MTDFNLMLVASDGKLPEWIRLLPLGEVNLADGRESFTVDAASLEQIVAAFRTRGIDMVVDYEHESLAGGRAPAAGWIKELQARDDGLWGRVDWTPAASEYLKNKEYRYFSPVLRLDPETRKPLALLHMGLTNVPAINHLTPLVAKAEAFADARAQQEARAKKYGIGVKEGSNVGKPGEWSQVPDEQFADPVNYRYPMPDHDQTKAAWSYWNQAKNQAQYTPAERGIIEKRIKSRAKAVGMQIQEAKPMKEQLMKLLGITGEQPDEEILALADTRVKQAAALPEIAQALGLKPEATVSEITGTVLALKQGQEHFTTLQAEVAALKAENAKTKAAAAVEEALKAGKMTPAQVDWAMEYAGRDLEGFKVFVEKSPKIVPVGEEFRIAGQSAAGPEGLTPDELAVCKQLNLTPEAFKAQRQAQQEG